MTEVRNGADSLPEGRSMTDSDLLIILKRSFESRCIDPIDLKNCQEIDDLVALYSMIDPIMKLHAHKSVGGEVSNGQWRSVLGLLGVKNLDDSQIAVLGYVQEQVGNEIKRRKCVEWRDRLDIGGFVL